MSAQKNELPHTSRYLVQFAGCEGPIRSFLLSGVTPEAIIIDIFEKPALNPRRIHPRQTAVDLDHSFAWHIRSKVQRQPPEILFLLEFLSLIKQSQNAEARTRIPLYFLGIGL